jgi:hypothetical protein
VTEFVVVGADSVTVFSTVVVLAGVVTGVGAGVVAVFVGVDAVPVFVGVDAAPVLVSAPEPVDGVVRAAASLAWVFAASAAVPAFSETVPDADPSEPQPTSAKGIAQQTSAIAPILVTPQDAAEFCNKIAVSSLVTPVSGAPIAALLRSSSP